MHGSARPAAAGVRDVPVSEHAVRFMNEPCLHHISREGSRPTVIAKNRLFTTNALSLKSLLPGNRASEAILASEFFGKIGQSARWCGKQHPGLGDH